MRKRWIGLALALCLFAAAALAEGERFALRLDEGFTMSLPAGWVSYPVREGPIRYALGPAEGGRFLYILIQPTALEGLDALRAAIETAGDCDKTSPLDLNGREFAAFIAPGLNASGCATIHENKLITLLFTPQDNSDYMLLAAEIMSSIRF